MRHYTELEFHKLVAGFIFISCFSHASRKVRLRKQRIQVAIADIITPSVSLCFLCVLVCPL